MPTKCCWVIHGSLTSERKASISPSSFINHSTLLECCSIERSSAKLLVFACTSKVEHSTGSESERVDALGLRAFQEIICMITRDFSVISMTSQASLSLSLSTFHITKVTDAQYRKRFRASYNKKGEFDGARCPFSTFWVSKVITTAHAHKSGVIFIFFQELSNKKIKALRPKIDD